MKMHQCRQIPRFSFSWEAKKHQPFSVIFYRAHWQGWQWRLQLLVPRHHFSGRAGGCSKWLNFILAQQSFLKKLWICTIHDNHHKASQKQLLLSLPSKGIQNTRQNNDPFIIVAVILWGIRNLSHRKIVNVKERKCILVMSFKWDAHQRVTVIKTK